MNPVPPSQSENRNTRILYLAIGGTTTAIAIGLAVMFTSAWSVWNAEPAVPPRTPATAVDPPTPPLDLLDSPISGSMTATRLVESIDPLRQYTRAVESRIRVSVAVNQIQDSFWTGRHIATLRRDTDAYLLGRPPRSDGTTIMIPRCALADVERRGTLAPSFVNLALLIEPAGPALPLRFAPHDSLAGTNENRMALADGTSAPLYIPSTQALRYALVLGQTDHQMVVDPGVGVALIDQKLVLLRLPAADPELAALGPNRFLRIREVQTSLRSAYDILATNTPGFPERLAADLGAACSTPRAPRRAASALEIWLTAATSLHLAHAVAREIPVEATGPALFLQLQSLVANREQLSGAIVRTVFRRIIAADIVDVRFEETVLVVELRSGRETQASRIAVVGVTNLGLSDDDAQRVIGAVWNFLLNGNVSAAVGSDLGDPDEGACVQPQICRGTFIARDARIELAAELLARGLVRVRTDDARLVMSQPSLVVAAREGLDNKRAAPVATDEGYRSVVEQLRQTAPERPASP